MAIERKTKAFTYKQAVFLQPGPVLKDVLEKALDGLKTIGHRRESLAPADESPIWRLIGEFSIETEFVFGVLVRYAPGTNPLFVVDDETAERLTVEQMAAPQTDQGKRRELVDAMLFFGVSANHLVMMQSSSLRSDHLEKHLQWLLHSARAVDGGNSLQLIDQPPKAIREKLAKAQVKELDIGGALTPPPVAAPPTVVAGTGGSLKVPTTVPVVSNIEEQSVIEASDEGSGGIVDAIKRLLSPDQAAKLDFDKMAGANIEYTLKIRYKNSTTEDGQRLMNTLGSALRHAEGVETRIKLKKGGEIKGNELRLSGNVRINTYNGVPAPTEVFEEIRKWLLEKLKSGDVEATSRS